MASPLRNRRRQKTADDIQQVTLHLAAQHGLDAVTTGMIAEGAGISVRTFFNYYTNKEAAAVGDFYDFPEDCVGAFASGAGPLAPDLERLIQSHLDQVAHRRETIRDIIALTHAHPALQLRHTEVLRRVHGRLVAILSLRLGDEDRASLDFIAELCIAVIRQAVVSWTDDDSLTLDKAVEIAFAQLRRAVQVSII